MSLYILFLLFYYLQTQVHKIQMVLDSFLNNFSGNENGRFVDICLPLLQEGVCCEWIPVKIRQTDFQENVFSSL